VSKAPVSESAVNDDMVTSKRKTQLFGLGEDSEDGHFCFTSRDGKYESGFFMAKEDTFGVQADLVNYNKEEKKVFVTVEIEYVDSLVGADAVSNLMSVIACEAGHGKNGGAYIHLNQTGVAVRSSSRSFLTEQSYQREIFMLGVPYWTLSQSIVLTAFIGGHLYTEIKFGLEHMLIWSSHEGSEEMTIVINGKEFCESLPTYGTGGSTNKITVTGISSCLAPIPVKKGNMMTMNAVNNIARHSM
jgi:hypothetical protein